jgi:hypothetical protein
MAMSSKTRATIHQQFEPILGEEAIEEMLSYFPARDVEEPATKEFVRAEIAALRTDMVAMDGRLSSLIQSTARNQTIWLVSAVMAAAGLIVAAVGVSR